MARQHLSMRVNSSTLKDLDVRARELGMTRSALAERYIDEGLRMDRHHGIIFWQRPGGREPMIAGTRLSVREVVDTFKECGGSIKETAEWYGRHPSLIETALVYYASHTAEIDALIDEAREFAEREEAAWLRQRELLG